MGESTTTEASKTLDIDAIYRELVRGVGHEHVNDDNVDALIRRADADGHTILAAELREWSAPCG